MISVIVVTHDSASCIRACLGSLEDGAGSVPYETIVVDNCSSDGTADVVTEGFPGAVVIRSERNLGYAGGCNLGALSASGDILLLLGPDSTLGPCSLESLVRGLTPDGVWVAGLNMNDPAGAACDSFGSFPTARHALQLASRGRLGPLRPDRRLAQAVSHDATEPFEVPYVCGGGMAVKRQAWIQLGGLDEDFFLYFEETEFCKRVWREGRMVVAVPSACATHAAGSSFGPDQRGRRDRLLQGSLVYATKTKGVFYAHVIRAFMSLTAISFAFAAYLTGRDSNPWLADIRAMHRRGLPRVAPRPGHCTSDSIRTEEA